MDSDFLFIENQRPTLERGELIVCIIDSLEKNIVSANLVFGKNRFSVTIGKKTGTVLPFKAQMISLYLLLVVSTKVVLKR